MIYLLWSLLNLFLILSFYYFAIGLIVKGRNFLGPYFKPFVLFVLVFGTFGCLKSASKALKEEVIYIEKPMAKERFFLKKHLSLDVVLTLYRDKESGEISQEYSTSDLEGLMLGLRWNHLQVVEKEGNLEVDGWWDLFLLGNRVFSYYETYEIRDKDLVMN